jgi:hypothetical protein
MIFSKTYDVLYSRAEAIIVPAMNNIGGENLNGLAKNRNDNAPKP